MRSNAQIQQKHEQMFHFMWMLVESTLEKSCQMRWNLQKMLLKCHFCTIYHLNITCSQHLSWKQSTFSKKISIFLVLVLFLSYLLLKCVFYSYLINKLHSCVIFLMFFCPSFHRWCSTTESPPLHRTKRQTARGDAGNERVNNTFLIKMYPWYYNITKMFDYWMIWAIFINN